MNPIETIHVSSKSHRAWVTVTRTRPRRYSRTWSHNYDHVTPSSLARAQRAQLALAGMRMRFEPVGAGKTRLGMVAGALAGHHGGKG